MANKAPFKIEFYVDPRGNAPCMRWMERDLTPIQREAVIAAIEKVLAFQGIRVCGTSYGRHIPGRKGLFEFRLNKDASEILRQFEPDAVRINEPKSERILIRIFCHAYGNKVVLLLGGYDKGRDPNKKRQQREIETAAKRLAEFKRRT